MNRTHIHIFVNSFRDTKSKNARLKNDSVLHGRSQEKTYQLFGSSRRTIAQVRSCCSKQQALVSDICLSENLRAIVYNNRSRVTVPAFSSIGDCVNLAATATIGQECKWRLFNLLLLASPKSILPIGKPVGNHKHFLAHKNSAGNKICTSFSRSPLQHLLSIHLPPVQREELYPNFKAADPKTFQSTLTRLIPHFFETPFQVSSQFLTHSHKLR